MAVFQSAQSATSDNTGSVVITKPVSLVVGDLLVAAIWTDRDSAGSATLNTPTGWTQEANETSAADRSALAVFSKIADSGDVGATNFTFAASGSTQQLVMIGHLLRFTDAGYVIGATTGSGTSGTTVTVPSITPTAARANSTYIIAMARVRDTPPAAFSGVAIANSNPSWTSRAVSAISGASYDSRMEVFTAVRSASTATGAATLTYGTEDSTRSAGIMVGYVPRQNGTVTPVTNLNAYAISPIKASGGLDLIVENPVDKISTPAIWTSETKPSTTWINEQK